MPQQNIGKPQPTLLALAESIFLLPQIIIMSESHQSAGQWW